MATTAAPAAAIQIGRIETRRILVPVRGTAPLIMHKFSAKAKQQMLDAMQGRKNVKEHKDPEKDYLDTIYHTAEGEIGFPTLGFKAATVGGARLYKKNALPMTQVRQFIRFDGKISDDGNTILTAIEGTPIMREDYVTVGIAGRDLRYRAQFTDWSAVLDVTYVASALDETSVVSLIDAGGLSIGVGEWRPEKDGLNGTYTVEDTEIKRLS